MRRNFERSTANTITAATATNSVMIWGIGRTFRLGPEDHGTGSGGLNPQGCSARWLSPDPSGTRLLHIQSVSGIEPRRLAKYKTNERFPLAADLPVLSLYPYRRVAGKGALQTSASCHCQS